MTSKSDVQHFILSIFGFSIFYAPKTDSTRRIRVEDLDVDPFGVGIINICMNTSIRNPRETKGQPQAGGAPPAGVVFVSRGLLMLVFMQMLMIPTPKGSTSRSSTRIRSLFEASNPFSGHQKIENSKMLRIEFWTSDFDVKKCSKWPRDPHNRIRLEKLFPKVVSDRQNAGRMTSKRRFWHFCLIRENRALNVNPKWSPWIGEGSRRGPRPFKGFHPTRPF